MHFGQIMEFVLH